MEINQKYYLLSDLVTYDTSSYQTISVAEEKLTNAIVSVTSEKNSKGILLRRI